MRLKTQLKKSTERRTEGDSEGWFNPLLRRVFIEKKNTPTILFIAVTSSVRALAALNLPGLRTTVAQSMNHEVEASWLKQQ